MPDLSFLFTLVAVFLFFGLPLLRSAVKIVQEYERGVIFRLGRVVPEPKGPGLFFIIPFVDRMVMVDLRTITLDVPTQEAITRDNVTLRINAVVYFRVLHPVASVVSIENYRIATSQIAQTTLRNVIGQFELDELLSDRESINKKLQTIIDDATEPWGIKVSIVEVKDLELPEVMKRAMARQAEAEREKRAKFIHAEGELQAAQQLAEAANVMDASPSTLQLRYLQTLTDIAVEHNSTIVFPLPLDMIKPFMQMSQGSQPETPKPPTLFGRETGKIRKE